MTMTIKKQVWLQASKRHAWLRQHPENVDRLSPYHECIGCDLRVCPTCLVRGDCSAYTTTRDFIYKNYFEDWPEIMESYSYQKYLGIL